MLLKLRRENGANVRNCQESNICFFVNYIKLDITLCIFSIRYHLEIYNCHKQMWFGAVFNAKDHLKCISEDEFESHEMMA